MENTFFTFVGAAAIGMVVGTLTGVFGVGGGFLMTPALIILLGIPAPIAVGTDLAAIFINSIVGIIRRRDSKTVDFKLGAVIASAAAVGVLAGSQALEAMKRLPRIIVGMRELDLLEYTLLWLFCFVLSAIAAYLYWDWKRNAGASPVKRIGFFAKIHLPPYVIFNSLEEPRLPLIPLFVLGFILGLLTGLMGVGGGVVLLPSLIYLIGQRATVAAGTSLMLVTVSSGIGVFQKTLFGDVDILLLVALLAGSIPGTLVGTKIGLQLPGPKIRIYFVYVVMSAILMIIWKLYCLTFCSI